MTGRTAKCTFVGRVALVLVAILALGLGSTPSLATMTDYQRQQVTQYLHSPKTNMDAGVFDGQAFNPSVSLNDATSYMNDYVKTLNRAVQAWNKLTSGATGSPDGQALLKELNDKLDFAQAMQTAYPAFQASQGSEPAAQESGTAGGGESESEAASGGMSDYQKEQMTQYLESAAMRKDSAVFDGKAFVAGVPFDAFEQYYQGYMKNLDRAISTWERQVSSSSKATPDGRALQKQLQASMDWGNAMTAQYGATKEAYLAQQQAEQEAQQEAEAAAAAKKEAHRQQCVAFLEGAMKPLARAPMTRLINQMRHDNSGLGSVEAVDQHRQVAAEVLGVCRAVNYQFLTSQPCYYVVGEPGNDPINWCTAAHNAEKLIKKMVVNQARQTIAAIGSSTIQSPEELHDQEGWLTFEGPITFQDKLIFSSHGREDVMDNIAQVLAEVGIEDAEEALWSEQKARLDALRAEVEKTAASWQSPPNRADNYSTALAAEQIKEWHSDAEVEEAYLSRKSWKIYKNALGIPDRRTLPGYVIFKLPDDPYCQIRSYTLTEQYEGGSSYQKAAGVRFGYVRFQVCP